MNYSLAIIASLLISSACFAAKTLPEDRTYAHHLFRTQKDCEKAQKDNMWMNCTQTLDLRSDGSASVMLTDIMNSASYELSGNQLIVKSTSPGDMPAKMVFTLDRTGRNLVSGSEVWELQQACE